MALAAALGGCMKPGRATPRGCLDCHQVHYVREGTCAECHRGDPAAQRAEQAHLRLLNGAAAAHRMPASRLLRDGLRLVDALACRRCHTIGGRGNALATNLDRVVWRRQQAELETSISEPAESMPTFGLSRAQAERLVAALLSQGEPAGAQASYRVHFEAGSRQTGTFERSCGGCHRALTAGGPLGAGNAGPNLSGIFSTHYPKTAKDGAAWTTQRLDDWLRNPRAVRPGTTMPPVRLSDDERSQLHGQLGAGADTAHARQVLP
jgi:cytochrome c2